MSDTQELESRIIEGVSQAVTRRLSEEAKEKFVTKEELREFSELMQKRLNGGFGRIDEQDRKEMLPYVHSYFLTDILEIKGVKAIAPTTGSLLDLIPTEIGKILIEKLNTYSILRKNCTVYPGEKGVIPVEAASATAGRITTRGTPVSEAAPTYTPISYSTVGMQAWLSVDNKVARESPAQIFDWATTMLAKAFAAAEYTEFITGDGNNKFRGLQNSNITTVTCITGTTIPTITLDDMTSLYFGLPAGYRYQGLNKTWLIASGNLMARLQALNGAGQENFDVKTTPPTWFGRPAWEHENVATSGTTHAVAYFGDLSYYYIFDKLGLILKKTDAGKDLILADQTLVALYGETDGKLILPDAFRQLKLKA